MKNIALVMILTFCMSAFAGFGGGRSSSFSGSRSSSSRSYSSPSRSSSFGGNRSSSRPAPIVRSNPPPSSSTGSTHTTTVIHSNGGYGYGYGGGGGFWTGLMMGHLFSQPQQPIIMQGAAQGPDGQPVIVQQQSGFSFWGLVFNIFLLGCLIFGIWLVVSWLRGAFE